MPTQLSAESYTKHFRGLFVGPTGRGKTIAAASWPGKTLILDFDTRHDPVIQWFPDRLEDFYVEVITPFNYWSVFHPLVNKLVEYNPYQNIILDGVTSLSATTVIMQMIQKGVMKDWSGSSKDERREAGKITAGGVVVPTWDEFNGEAMLISTLLDCLKSLKCNLFLTAHPVKRIKIEGQKGASYQSITTFGPKVESIIPTYFNEVWYFDYDVVMDSQGKPSVQRTVYTGPSFEYQEAKTGLKGLPLKMDITNKNLYDVVKEYL